VVIYVILGTVLIALISFALTATGLGLLLSFALGLLAWLFFRLVDPEERGRTGLLRVLITAGGGSALGVAGGLLLGISHVVAFDVAGVAVTTIVAAAVYSVWARRDDPACALCKRPAREGASFKCPRCSDRVCARPECWNARYGRCARCHEREIVIFPIADKWWDRRLGPRAMQGECVSCLKEAHETDLRECGQCHWPTCRRCWDYNNGACQRCGWVMPDTPPALAAVVRQPSSARRDRHRAPRAEQRLPGENRGGARGGRSGSR
jgi:hypothetical protein